MILLPKIRCRCWCPAHGALTALMMLVWPEPGIQPVTTITMSPDLKNPRAFPDDDSEPELNLSHGPNRANVANTETRSPISMPKLTLLSTSSAQTGAGRGWKRTGKTPLRS